MKKLSARLSVIWAFVPSPFADETRRSQRRVQQQWQASVAFSSQPIENIIAKALAIALEHEHANECEGSPVKNTSKPKFAHACAESVLQFAFNATVEVPI